MSGLRITHELGATVTLRDHDVELFRYTYIPDGPQRIQSEHLARAGIFEAAPAAGDLAFGMCGRRRTYDVSDHAPNTRPAWT